jgi:hypothetical protein
LLRCDPNDTNRCRISETEGRSETSVPYGVLRAARVARSRTGAFERAALRRVD